MRKKKYEIDLARQMAVCEVNYARICQLLPGYDVGDQCTFGFDVNDQQLELHMRVLESWRYTTLVRVEQKIGGSEWLPDAKFDARVCHDACVAEVIKYQNHHRLEARYEYPNDNMHLPDEKEQANRYLAECLLQCARYGYTLDPEVVGCSE